MPIPSLPLGASHECPEESVKVAPPGIRAPPEVLGQTSAGVAEEDALIAATARRYDASVWTLDGDYLKFLPKARVRVMRT